MTGQSSSADTETPAFDAALIAMLLAVDPVGLGGVSLRGYATPAREQWLQHLRQLLPEDAPWRRVPLGIADDRLLGGLDLTATLRIGSPVAQKGLLAEADGGFLVLAMAERMETAHAARIAAAMDQGEIATGRDGVMIRADARFGAVALDEGLEPGENPPQALLDRLAFRIDMARLDPRDTLPELATRQDIGEARARLPGVTLADDALSALTQAALAFGIPSLRAVVFAVRAARAAAALEGRVTTDAEDIALAARLVFAPRATTVPASQEPEEQAPPEPEPAENEPQEPAPPETEAENGDSTDDEERALPDKPLQEMIAKAVQVALPAELLAGLLAGAAPAGVSPSHGRGEQSRKSRHRGRPIGARRGVLQGGTRLALLDTLRAAAPWQALRRAEQARGRTQATLPSVLPRILVRPEDFRILRFKQRIRTTTIFVVDASGSAALHRLAEAKGAVELLLAECYVRRDEVALVAFRGKGADVLLPPTRSLTRTKRSLARLPGGGGTPLAAGIDAARLLALEVQRKGDRPLLVFLTDGQANVARDGAGNRGRAQEEAMAAARVLRANGVACLFIDTSPRPNPRALAYAREMNARYLPLPAPNPAALARLIHESGKESGKKSTTAIVAPAAAAARA